MILEFLSDPICFTMKSIFEFTLILDCDPPTILMKKRLSRKSLAAYLRFSKAGTLSFFLSFHAHSGFQNVLFLSNAIYILYILRQHNLANTKTEP